MFSDLARANSHLGAHNEGGERKEEKVRGKLNLCPKESWHWSSPNRLSALNFQRRFDA